MLGLGRLFYVSLLLINAMAVLSEERFLARIGWSTAQAQSVNQGFGQPYAQSYEQQGYAAGQDIGVKGRIINLISAVRTLMRIPLIGLNLVIIIYEVLWG
ncbi:Yos1-like protein [Dichomitus squalens]|uniref:Yos1-like protein n=1 Tax=Dichomitus squalens TaxID=114155 RepID=A0A4Q9Q956_9APHY|nr:Yos1-like protein [Dichomitus squalens]TBU49378.1 Yos1-like protein [Dichomitus squalens]TBU64025.1 Yos1-like protein [Dichomitus squalens]